MNATAYPEKKITDPENLLPEISKRWSPRAYADKPVSEQTLRTILEAGRWAPSSYNGQPWRFIVAQKEDTGSWDKALKSLVDFNRKWASSAPVLILTLAKKTFDHNDKPNRHSWHDAGMANMSMALQATKEGLHMHFMAGYDADTARDLFKIPEDYEVVTAAALGHMGELERIPEEMHEQETGERSRKDLSELVFGESFGETIDLVK